MKEISARFACKGPHFTGLPLAPRKRLSATLPKREPSGGILVLFVVRGRAIF